MSYSTCGVAAGSNYVRRSSPSPEKQLPGFSTWQATRQFVNGPITSEAKAALPSAQSRSRAVEVAGANKVWHPTKDEWSQTAQASTPASHRSCGKVLRNQNPDNSVGLRLYRMCKTGESPRGGFGAPSCRITGGSCCSVMLTGSIRRGSHCT